VTVALRDAEVKVKLSGAFQWKEWTTDNRIRNHHFKILLAL
jgi:hypothetical protein